MPSTKCCLGHGLSYTTFEYRDLRVTPAQINPGGTAIKFEITPDRLSFLDAQLERCVEPGIFALMIGSSSERIQTVLLKVAA